MLAPKKQGLITELSETSDDIGHQIKLKNSNENTCFPPPAETVLWLVAHIPCTQMKTHQVPAYRTAIMDLARRALVQLPLTGVFVVGAQDIRTEKGKLLPMGMLLLEDIVRVVGDDCLRLKELSKLKFTSDYITRKREWLLDLLTNIYDPYLLLSRQSRLCRMATKRIAARSHLGKSIKKRPARPTTRSQRSTFQLST